MALSLRTLTLGLSLVIPSLALAAPPAGDAASTLMSVPPGVVDGATARRLVAAGARLVDVRSQEEYDAGHLEGALLVPYNEIAARASEIGQRGTPIVLYCRTGRRTAIAAKALAELGYTQVWDMQGMRSWQAGQ